jgi:hypothetical protein
MSRPSLNSILDDYPSHRVEPLTTNSPIELPSTFVVENAQSIGIVRAPRRCSICRQIGHNRRGCPTANARVPIDQPIPTVLTTSDEGTRRQRLSRIIISFLEFTLPNGAWRENELWMAIFITYLGSLTNAQVEEAILSPFHITSEVIRIIYTSCNPNSDVLLGKHYAKKISLVLDISCEDKVDQHECFICCDSKCSIKANCGHQFCSTCVNTIIDTGKNKTSAPFCSFCRLSFSSFTTTDHFAYSTVADFIKNL